MKNLLAACTVLLLVSCGGGGSSSGGGTGVNLVARTNWFEAEPDISTSTLPGSEMGLAFRPVSNTLGAMDPDTTPLASASIECAS